MRRLEIKFASRYLRSKRSHSVINIISRVSSVAVGVPVAALIIIMSVFNGFEEVVQQVENHFDPDVVIKPSEGKFFVVEASDLDDLTKIDGVEAVSCVVEENALFRYREREHIGTIRGVDSNFHKIVPIETMITQGDYELKLGVVEQALVGQGVAYNLGVNPALLEKLEILIPYRSATSFMLPIGSYREASLFVAGVFTLDRDTDSRFVLTPIESARRVVSIKDSQVSSLMVKVADGQNPVRVKQRIERRFGEEYEVLTRGEQNKTVHRMMMYEKWGMFSVGIMVLIIASFSIIGSIVMLIIEKRRDIGTLVSLGADVGLLRRIFTWQGMMVATYGALGGLLLGLCVCWAQVLFGVVKMPGQLFLVDNYPVKIIIFDIATIVVVFVAVSYLITRFTVIKMIPRSTITR